MIKTTTSNDRNDVCEEIWSDCSDYYCSEDESCENQKSTSIVQHAALRCTVVGNSVLLYDLSERISTVWKQVGRNLKIKECIIENIDIDHYKDDEKEKAYQLLLEWSRQHGSQAKLQDLLNVLIYIGRRDIANAICADFNKPRPASVSSVASERAVKLEIKSHIKLQKKVLRKLTDALQFYQQRLKEVEDLQHRHFEETEAIEMKKKLQELDKSLIKSKLDSLQEQVYSMQEKEQKYSELDQQLRVVADKLYELDKTFKQFNDAVDELRVSYYTQVECNFVGLCRIRHTIFPRGGLSAKHETSSKKDEAQRYRKMVGERIDTVSTKLNVSHPHRRYSGAYKHLKLPALLELEDDVFEGSTVHDSRERNVKTSSHSRVRFARNTLSRSSLSKLSHLSVRSNKTSHRSRTYRLQEEHTNRKLSVSNIDMDEQVQLQEFVKKFCHRYRQNRPFIFGHCCMNRDLQESLSRDEFDLQPPSPTLSPIDLHNSPIPRYQSSEAIISLVTSPSGNHSPRGFLNVTSVWI